MKGIQILAVILTALLLSFNANVYGQNQPEKVSVTLFSAYYYDLFTSTPDTGRLVLNSSQNFYFAEVSGRFDSPVHSFIKDGRLSGDFRMHFIASSQGKMTSFMPDVFVRGTLELSTKSNWKTLWIQETDSNGGVYNTWYLKIGDKYDILYPRKKAEKSCDTAEHYVELDESYRKLAAQVFKLPEDSSWEKMRPVIAKRYDLKEDASWEDIREKRIFLKELSTSEVEAERKEWAAGLCLPESTSWPDLRKELEKYKRQ